MATAPEVSGETEPGSASERAGLQLISRAAAVLRALAGHQGGLSLRQIAKSAGLPRATVARIVDALEVEQFVTVDGARSGVRLGPGLAALAGATRIDFQAIARPHLETLCAEVQETIILTVRRGDRAVSVDQVVSDRPVNLSVKSGLEFPLHATAAGKAILATLPDEELAAILREPLEAYTPQTTRSEDALRQELAEIARSGLAVDWREHGEHDFALATAVLDQTRWPYSISILLPEARVGEGKSAYAAPLLRCRDRIHAAIGRRLTERNP
jgi:DNA-binding IclR family transcriptional regulator